jgi:hypothetical protein
MYAAVIESEPIRLPIRLALAGSAAASVIWQLQEQQF